ncbi:hypothetical protein [Bradyrhizobium sp. 187]|uniref:hypothetical protein n=1 Tax=Bradyrhizobium sp. 187 TaxID=2782655 RepID=UPI001FFF1D16|nr:hypothetical protein [Bradyrhizobium sp. 187]UPJ73546.1 hypothetical protein IVB19_02885 [Bradyrhizobium sp. 187]
MSENRKKFKSKYPLKLSDEKRAFVVIALTDKLSLAGKAAAANALAHYDSRKGYAYASIPTMTREAGYAPSSTKTLNNGLKEIHDKGAFKVVRRTGATNTHHICPILAWFKAEYEHLRKSGRVEEDEFANIRDAEDISGSQPEMNQGSEQEKSGSGLKNSGSQPNNSGSEPKNPGSEPDEEGSVKRASEEDQEKRIKPRWTLASGERGPDVGLDVDDRTTPPEDRRSRETQEDKVVQDNQKDDRRLEQYREAGEKIWLMFHKAPVKQHDRFIELFVELAQAEEIKSSEEVRYGLMCHLRDTEPKWQKSPVNFLTERVWKTYRATASGAGETQKRMAI